MAWNNKIKSPPIPWAQENQMAQNSQVNFESNDFNNFFFFFFDRVIENLQLMKLDQPDEITNPRNDETE